jgi:hypothetical protein
VARAEGGSKLELARLLRGGHKRAVEEVLALLPAAARVEDLRGKVLAGAADASTSERAPIVVGGVELGAVVGGVGVQRVATLVAHLHEREQEKLALAAETLGRYKELTVLYDTASALSRVLDVEEVATKIVAEAHRFLRASEAALYLLDRRGERLDPIASAGAEAGSISLGAALSGGELSLEVRAIALGQAELVEQAEAGGSVMVAPLRSGEASFGLLRVATADLAGWTAGDLKLVTSLAANAASAISHAMLHRDQLRQQALRNQIERYVSPTLLEAALEGCDDDARKEAVAVLFCDAGELARSMDAAASPEEVLGAMLAATSAATDVLLAHGATVSSVQGEMLVALFCADPRGVGEGARTPGAARSSATRAVQASVALIRRLDQRYDGPFPRSPGIGIALIPAERVAVGELEPFFEGVGAAATIQAEADGRILVDAAIAREVGLDTSLGTSVSGSKGTIEVHEVRP